MIVHDTPHCFDEFDNTAEELIEILVADPELVTELSVLFVPDEEVKLCEHVQHYGEAEQHASGLLTPPLCGEQHVGKLWELPLDSCHAVEWMIHLANGRSQVFAVRWGMATRSEQRSSFQGEVWHLAGMQLRHIEGGVGTVGIAGR